ncbi:type I restriction endonuclease subunit R [Chryseobacterium sp. 2987]|uniref:type I restriction endonuclease subunit R n=1 Tax=Chryseobacterium sp. 2987 TaxID=2817767 RepID=UPI0028620040|nr:type I restriction endonuclease subunit R [Chryseobacterium sp. 2987]MDR6923004.1 type I restriction enzyme R subunit [Chryseobacterium sp. 2987]
MTTQTEQALENGLIKTLIDNSYEYVQLREENLYANFKSQLEKHNKKRLAEAGRTAFTDKEFEKIRIHLEGGTRFEKAKKLRDLYPLDTEDGQRIWVEFLDRQKWCKNEFQVSNQITTEGRKKCRYDVTILINGLPLVQIELKRKGTELKEAYNQIQQYYKTSYTGLFDYVQLFIISNGVNTRYFANNPNGGYNFTFNWTDTENVPYNDLSQFANSFLERCSLGKMISKYIVLHEGDRALMVLRPYQYYAVEKILTRIENTAKNGYIWHTTGAGKTLTSFKTAQLASEIDGVDKVIFVVDRRDLDTQTQSEYDAFEKGAVDGTDNTYELIKRLGGNSKIIITTIQKLNNAVTRDRYNKHLQEVREQKVVMIFDECHRSQFGDSHRNIRQFFSNLQIFGFTGTPIFAKNANEHTTAEIFDDCLHKYLIKDAIADDNVLGFLVEYYKGNTELGGDYMNETRMTEIAKFILGNFHKSTADGEFNALFATQSITALVKYYKLFKQLNPEIKIGAVFTFPSISNQDDENTGMGQGFANEKVTSDELADIMSDYNQMFDTSFSTENFGAYYDDINLRMKKKKPEMEPLDLLLVVNMFLTGFDAKKLNTLYVDKNLEYHGLLQAFSRTNRILNDKKQFGKIICFRNLKANVDEAIKLFSNNQPVEHIIRGSYDEVKGQLSDLMQDFKEKYPEVQIVDLLQSEDDRRDFVLDFRDIIKKRAEIQVYDDFDAEDSSFPMTNQEFVDFRSKYLDIADRVHTSSTIGEDPQVYGNQQTLEDIDFCLELLHSDIINVSYILKLMAGLDTKKDDYEKERQRILDTISNDSQTRNKTPLFHEFMQENIDNNKEEFERSKTDGTLDLESLLNEFITRKRDEAIHKLADEEGINVEALAAFIAEYDYLRREKPEIIQDAVKQIKVGLNERRTIIDRVSQKLKTIISVFSWD